MPQTQLKRRSSEHRITRIEPSRPTAAIAEDVIRGLTRADKELHPKYFYDERGSELFDRICDTPEYYLTRTEQALLGRHAGRIMHACRPRNVLEFGSGTSRKTRLLLGAWTDVGPRTYWPFDVSAEMLEGVVEALAVDYPDLAVHGLIGDYNAGLENLPRMTGVTLALFLGSTLGNFEPHQGAEFFDQIARRSMPGDYLLLGADLDKDPAVIEAAYNDRAGITAEFNRNVLAVLNRELDADFDLAHFEHRALYNRDRRQVEMYLISTRRQGVRIGALNLDLSFAAGEAICTEISRKFTVEELGELMAGAGFEPISRLVDETHPYALVLGRRV